MGALGFPDSSVGKESACNAGDLDSIPGLGRSPGERKGYPLQWPGEFYGLYSPWGHKESDTTEQLFHFSPGHTLGLVLQASHPGLPRAAASLPPPRACPLAFLQSLRGLVFSKSAELSPTPGIRTNAAQQKPVSRGPSGHRELVKPSQLPSGEGAGAPLGSESIPVWESTPSYTLHPTSSSP